MCIFLPWPPLASSGDIYHWRLAVLLSTSVHPCLPLAVPFPLPAALPAAKCAWPNAVTRAIPTVVLALYAWGLTREVHMLCGPMARCRLRLVEFGSWRDPQEFWGVGGLSQEQVILAVYTLPTALGMLSINTAELARARYAGIS
jgi:hypothetical protein